jgi:hypothetical protein
MLQQVLLKFVFFFSVSYEFLTFQINKVLKTCLCVIRKHYILLFLFTLMSKGIYNLTRFSRYK